MPERVSRPIIFVSSTISDLADLREALKFWLEEMGFQVQMSEHNDFQRRPNMGTFQACFQSIRESDFYVLLVGKARGSWFDERARVTVTQQEYRTAYDSLLGSGKPSVLAFVRRDVLTILEEQRKSGTHPSEKSILEDSAFTSGFVDEIRRKDEEELAVAGGGEHPIGNWVTPFATFRELIDAMRSSLRIREPLAKKAILENLRYELAGNLRIMMTRFHDRPFYHHSWLTRVRREVQLKIEDTHPGAEAHLSFEQIKDLHIYCVTGTFNDRFIRSCLDDAISSGTLLDYDVERKRYIVPPLLAALYRLREEFDAYSKRYHSVTDFQPQIMRIWNEVRRTKIPGSVPGFNLALVFGVYDREQDIARLLVGILRYLYGHTNAIDVMYRPISPIVGEDERIVEEVVSQEKIEDWLSHDTPLLRVGTIDLSEEQERNLTRMVETIRQQIGEQKFDEELHRIIEGDERPEG